METDIENPIEYNPVIEKEEVEETGLPPEQPYYMDYPVQPPMIQPQMHTEPEKNKFELFDKVDKSTWIIAFTVFLLGFFMGKTMQPVILRYT